MRLPGKIFVYLLECADNSIFIGNTHNLERCLVQHFNKEVKETAGKLPVTIRTYIAFNCKYKANAFEKFLKSVPGRIFIRQGWI